MLRHSRHSELPLPHFRSAEDLLFIHEMLIMTLRTNKMVTRYVSGEMVRPQITRSRNLTPAEICPSYCQTWCRARGPKLDSRHVDIGTCNERLVRNRFVSMLTHFGGDKILLCKLVLRDNPVFARIKTSTHTDAWWHQVSPKLTNQKTGVWLHDQSEAGNVTTVSVLSHD